MSAARPNGLEPAERGSMSIQSVAKAIEILRALTRHDGPLSVTELSTQLGLHKSTISRLLFTLEAGGLVTKDGRTGHYRLGLGLLEMAGVVLEDFDLRLVAQPHLLRLAEASGETINLGVLDRDEAVNIAQILSPRPVKRVGWIGRRNPLHCTAARVFLAFGSDALLQRVVARGLPAHTPHTITDPTALARELDTIRQRGYAVVRDEFEVGVTALSAPIRGRRGEVIAAVGLTGPSFRLSEDVLPVRAEQLLDAASGIMRDLSTSALVDLVL